MADVSQQERDELFAEAMWRKCAKDPVFFFENYWHIQHPEFGAMLFDLYDEQKAALTTFMDERYVLTLKARQIGWTTIVASYAFWLVYFHPDRLIIFLSKGEREAKAILSKANYGFKRLPEWMKARGPRRERDNLQEMPFDNGSSIESLPSGTDPARGRSCYLIVVDEWAFLENQEEAWASIEPVADVGGRVIGLSTANGWGNWFHTEWVKAETGVGIFFPLFQSWAARSDRDDDWYESKRSSMPQWQLFQEYPRTPEEAFLKSGNPYFDVDKLTAIETIPPREGEILMRDFRTFNESINGPFHVWDLPEDGDAYVVGADVAEGLEWGDYSSAHVIHVRTGKVVAHWHGHCAPDEFGEELNEIGRFYNQALIGPENNNHGLTTCKALQRCKYPNIFYTRTVDERNKRETNKIGWSTNRKTRPLMLDDLATALREDTLLVVDKNTIGELRTFIRDKAGKLHGSPFDDRTMSLAIAEQMLAYARQHGVVDKAIPYMSLLWWDKTIDAITPDLALGHHNMRRAS